MESVYRAYSNKYLQFGAAEATAEAPKEGMKEKAMATSSFLFNFLKKYRDTINLFLGFTCFIMIIVWAGHDPKKQGLTKKEKEDREKIQAILLPIWIVFAVLFLLSLWKLGIGGPPESST